MGIYFRDILLTRISRGANNCGLHPLEKNSYFIMRFSPHIQLFYFNDRLEFCKFFEGKIKRINNADLFSQPPLLIFIKGANISGGHCMCIYKNCAKTKSPWLRSSWSSPLVLWECVVPIWPWQSCPCRWFWGAGSCRYVAAHRHRRRWSFGSGPLTAQDGTPLHSAHPSVMCAGDRWKKED